MRIVVALGGNALLERGERPDADLQERNVHRAVHALVPLALEHELIITHRNGPQVGVLALESADDHSLSRPYPFDALGAETQGLIGYWLSQDLGNALPGRQVVALVTQTVVDRGDPAFSHPTKQVGPVYQEEEARLLAEHRGWAVARDGYWWRRVVASPEPREIVELAAIERLVDAGLVVVCAGGGGIPVTRDRVGALVGIEAVVDKDLTAALLAERVGADVLLLLTDVSAVEVGHGRPEAEPIGRSTPSALRSYRFAAGSMGPKVDAACRFVERTGRLAAIGSLDDAVAIVAGERGTRVVPDGHAVPTPVPASAVRTG
jgi:carbamate kinase